MPNQASLGAEMHALVARLFPICRSLTGNGVRETLRILGEFLPGLEMQEVPSGTQCADWTVPDEWNIRDAYIIAPDGHRIAEFKKSNLHVLGYSVPVDRAMPLAELQEHLYSDPASPDAIPYEASYYKKRWGFCLTHNERQNLKDGVYRVYIDSTLAPGSLTYGELVIPGDTPEEIFVSTYVCHPSLANNELSGPVVATFLAQWLAALPRRRYTYRFMFGPETIGAIVFLSRNLTELQKRVVAGLNVTCVGDDRAYSYLPSRKGNALPDRAALHVLRHLAPDFKRYSFLDRGSDERHYCAAGVDLPVCSIMRSMYGRYPEYHTSKDDLSLVTPTGLAGGYRAIQATIMSLEANHIYRSKVIGEPRLDKRGMYPDMMMRSWEGGRPFGFVVCDFLAYCDGKTDVIEIAEAIEQPAWTLPAMIERLLAEDLIERVDR